MRIGEGTNSYAGTENVYLRAWFESSNVETKPVGKWPPAILYLLKTIHDQFFRADRIVFAWIYRNRCRILHDGRSCAMPVGAL